MIQSAGVIIIDDHKSDDPKVLAVRAYAHWDFPKGQLEEGETLADAAVRETMEEVSLNPLVDYTIVDRAPSIFRGAGKKKKEITYFLALRRSDTEPFLQVNPDLGKPEHDEFTWMSLSRVDAKMRGPLLEIVCSHVKKWCKRNA